MANQKQNMSQPEGATRVREFAQQEREQRTHPAIDALRSRPQTRGDDNRKLTEFMRIDRGQTE